MLSAIEREDDNINRQFQKKKKKTLFYLFVWKYQEKSICVDKKIMLKNFKKFTGHFNHIRCTIIRIRNNRLKNVSIFLKSVKYKNSR